MIKSRKNIKIIERLLYRQIPVYEIDPIRSDLDLDQIILSIEERIDRSLFKNIESIYIVSSEKMKQRKISAAYYDDSIYISTNEEDPNIQEDQIVKDILHEVAHSLEKNYGELIYGDHLLATEFLKKRLKIHQILEDEYHFVRPRTNIRDLEYNQILDQFYLSIVGYTFLNMIIVGIFTSAYSITSLSEYYSNGFDEFLFGDKQYLKETCPVLYNKIKSLYREVSK